MRTSATLRSRERNDLLTPPKGLTLVVMIPAYNEEHTIHQVVDSIPRQIRGIDVVIPLVIDDGSTDHTATRATEAGAVVVSNATNQGLAYSFRKGVDTALQLGADIIVNTDADNQYDQSQIPDLIEPILRKRADMVLGSRFKGHIEHMSFGKYWGNRLATLAVNVVSGGNVSDGQTGFRAFSRDAILRLNVLSNFTYTQETILEAVDKNLAIEEVPITFRKRVDHNRLFGSIWTYARRASSTLIMGMLRYHPMRTFFTIGGLVVLAGLLVGSRVILQFIATGAVEPFLPSAVFTVLCILLGVQLVLMGLVGAMLKQQRQLIELQVVEQRKNIHSPLLGMRTDK
ncbi:MAG: glycosyltransferase family 2 protein [Candidatus Diapherotrites archaeon]|nr:glycosyltransferase family 2 protein [Candidatus Diapherotrites archaeon]MDZ4256543.1 glycosyltransferase family 2 protein [archaeon]